MDASRTTVARWIPANTAMLFNSYIFILLFLPLVVAHYHLLHRAGLNRSAVAFLVFASLFFYGWWNPIYLALLLALIVANYGAVCVLIRIPIERQTLRKSAMIASVAGNLLVLAYFKYANFFVANIDTLTGANFALATILLPLGISFSTFQKISLLVDTYQGKVKTLNFLDYVLFVSFFPQLIAGPIVHHSEIMPQFQKRRRIAAETIALGAIIFSIGLFKKVLLADSLALYATPEFNAASAGAVLSAAAAWTGALAFTLQLYFDFSGYSDMAIGAGLLFGIRLPINFSSPYKAVNIIDFWRRWHITLSRFLRDYLYVPLGGNRHGAKRRYVNLFLTMLLGGFWHGAAWTFILWGALHGAYLIINHGLSTMRGRLGGVFVKPNTAARPAGRVVTFLAVVVGWVFFRSDDFDAAIVMLLGMSGANGLGIGTNVGQTWLLILPLLLLVWIGPNTQEITDYVQSYTHPHKPTMHPGGWLKWSPTRGRAVVCCGFFALSLLSLSKISEFLYFQF